MAVGEVGEVKGEDDDDDDEEEEWLEERDMVRLRCS